MIWSEAESLAYIREQALWDEFESYGVDFFFPLELFIVDGRVVGGVQGQEVDNSFSIGYFFIIEKGKGHGRYFVQQLKERYPTLQGSSLPSAVAFWCKTGMTIEHQAKTQHIPFTYQAGA